MHPLTGIIKNYPWGSRTGIAALRGLPTPSAEPEAELWLGDHPAGSAVLADGGRTLAEHIADAGPRVLGPDTARRFGARLPYLLKVIAVDAPLSLQVHPSARQAVEGHRRGVYGDPLPKPELVCALTPFTALAGFRPAAESAALFGALDTPAARLVARLLGAGEERAALRALLHAPTTFREALDIAESLDGPDYRLVGELRARYPDDPACLAPLFLRRHDLAPGEALFLDAGVLHCYLSGLAVEVMAGSDNVVRAGLTGKPVDVPELLRVLDPAATPTPVRPDPDGSYPAPCPYFRLSRLELDGVRSLAPGVPHIALCVEGRILPSPGPALGPGAGLFVGADEPSPAITGHGVVFLVSPGDGG
ncbi:mannose-6-phosphate isomerase, class I [Actinocorallia sp. API 0066]|uniref:mannose-6-phosphate isomerase, class I n=1 Tax=Actinocorallia sp. API 0066 TaxID=2896846 RepID=UPI001E28FB1D|nr:mannose-6-phosphate isomerase, class I [Actinocorallia sp. API 0066]MCD0449231.1 mannose-6-phosphate isomerase, class I [Actinocorallia sp. API 0066]